jgi:patatin-like phospholipase/acyl hydrolase
MSRPPIDAAGRINVLSIDGGGIRGIIPARILQQIEQQMGRPLHELFDLIGGTSTGGIIALGLGTSANRGGPYSAAELLRLYTDNGPAIFKKSWYTPIKSWFTPKYNPKALDETLGRYFGQAELDSALTPLLISSYDLQSQLPFFFKSHRIARDTGYNWRLTEAARATSAAPTFFPPLHLARDGASYALVDGGIFVNNPAMAAYAEARRLYPEAGGLVIVSVGTGDRDDRITYARAKGWGLLGWAKQIVPVMMDSVSEAVDYELGWIAGAGTTSKHYRLEPKLTGVSNEMDDASPANLENLRALAERYLAENRALIDEICRALQAGRGSAMPGVGPPA